MSEERQQGEHDEGSQRPARVGILGASGSTGTELIRQLRNHPMVELTFATSRQYAGKSLREVDPASPDIALTAPDQVKPKDADVVFVCLPHGTTARITEQYLAEGVRVVDLSGDLRLRSEKLHEEVYGTERSADIAKLAVYGLTEYNREKVKGARLVSNPGCYPTCSMLALGPLASEGWITGPVIIDAKSGISGAGRKPSPKTHFCSAVGDIGPYKLGRKHRHVPEIEQGIHMLGEERQPIPQVIFNPHTVPLERGMLATIVLEAKGRSCDDIRALYQERYKDEPFVEVLPAGQAARIRAAAGTNKAFIGIADVDGSDHVIITSTIDNLLKGAAGQAIQNMNLMMGWPETTGILPWADQPEADRTWHAQGGAR